MGNLLGRSNRVRQSKVLLESALVYYVLSRVRLSKTWPSVQRLNNALSHLEPWQIVAGCWLYGHLVKNSSLLLGLNAPHSSLYTEPDCHYSSNFARVRWLLIALDAGFLSTIRVRIPIIRNTLAIIMSVYYLIFSRQGENKVEAFRKSQTIESIKRTWEKGEHPLLQFVSQLSRPKLGIPMEKIMVPRPRAFRNGKKDPRDPLASDSVECSLFYIGTREELKREKKILFQTHGGGFVAQSPLHHADYLFIWAHQLKIPIISCNYRKAPQYPYPCGFNDCYDVYASIVETNGGVVGIESTTPLEIAIAGDSAGGNLAAAVTLKTINEGIQVPKGVHLIYPVLTLDAEFWMAKKYKPDAFHVDTIKSDSAPLPTAGSSAERSDSTSSTSNSTSTQVTVRDFSPSPTPNAGNTLSGTEHEQLSDVSMSRFSNHVPMSSRAVYAMDGVLPMRYMLKLAEAYLRNGGDPVTDMYLSPLRAPDHILKQFPQTYIHVGAVDPLLDDSIVFLDRIRSLNSRTPTAIGMWQGVSHAYMHVINFMPEAKEACYLSMMWISHILQVPFSPPSGFKFTFLETPPPQKKVALLPSRSRL